MNKKTIFLLAAVLAVGILGFFYYRSLVFSKQILRLEILGQDSANVGDEVEYTVKYKNNGNFVLEKPKIFFELPENSLNEDGKTLFTQDVKDIYPGDEEFLTFKARLLGKEGDLKVARARMTYVPHNLSARYESETTFTTKINSVPITVTYDLPSKVEKGKEISYSINYFSNIDYPLENLSIKISSPQGFTFESSDPKSLDNSEWKLKTLTKAQGGRITIKGVVSADPQSHLNFASSLGVWQNGTFIVIKEANQDVEVIQPLLFISELINGSSSYVASPGEPLKYQIFVRNIGSTSFDNLFLIARLDGSAFDFSTLRSDDGQAMANDNLIIFDSRQIPRLQHLPSQQETSMSFSVKLKDSWPIADTEKNNLFIKNKITIFDTNQEFDTKVNSKLEIAQKAYHASQQGIENSGPVPPQANKTTTYIVNWQVKNYFNDLKNSKVKALLPQGVTLTGKIFPENQISNFSFDSGSREVVWSAGDLSPGSESSIFFQVALTPSIYQQGKLADLIGQATVVGEDQFTGQTTQGTVPSVNTSLPDDPSNSGGGAVQ